MKINGKRLERKLLRTETFVFIIILALGVVIQIQSGQFFTANNIIDIMRSMTVPGIFALGTMMVLISGGTDISFPAIASLTLSITTKYMVTINYKGSILLVLLMAAVIGLGLGLVNGALVGIFRIPTLIASLGTTSMYTGILFGVLRAREIAMLPDPMAKLSNMKLISAYSETLGMRANLPAVFLVLVFFCILTWIIMQKTQIGRYIYAIGGDRLAAERVGIPMIRTQFFLYGYAGLLAGMGGITRVLLMGHAHPHNLLGSEMTVLAPVVLGGVRIVGGVGTITGSLLGIALFSIITNSLQLLGIPSYWQKFATGLFIIVGTGISAYQIMNKRKNICNVDVNMKSLSIETEDNI
jgi:simple sugar transport system permease protein